MRILAVPDKFRGTATGPEAAKAIAAAAAWHGDTCRELPLADGGEGTLDAFGGGNRLTEVTGPLGSPVLAAWRLDGDRAVIEMATASGLLLAGGLQGNDPVAATTAGTGQLIAAALAAGAKSIIVGMGGSATTDGGLGAVEVLTATGGRPFDGVEVKICTDVRTRFVQAAEVFGPQKGAAGQTLVDLTERLENLAKKYQDRFGIDVQSLDGSGAAGGLAGGLAALGGHLADGFAAVAEAAGFDTALAQADIVITGEGKLDAGSFEGKVVGGVIERARDRGIPVLVIAGLVDPEIQAPTGVTTIGLSDRFGANRSLHDTVACIQDAAIEYLGGTGRR